MPTHAKFFAVLEELVGQDVVLSTNQAFSILSGELLAVHDDYIVLDSPDFDGVEANVVIGQLAAIWVKPSGP